MPISLSVASAIEKSKIASNVPFLVLLDIAVFAPLAPTTLIETLRLTNNSTGITWNGNPYAPAQFDLDLSAESGKQSSLQLEIWDIARAIQSRMQEYGGGVGFTVTVTVLNSGNLSQPAEIQETFEITGASASQYKVRFTLGSENALAKNFPRRVQTRDFCQWRYRSTECGYTGGLPTCDLTLKGPNGCSAHNNTINFGGFPGINSNGRNYL